MIWFRVCGYFVMGLKFYCWFVILGRVFNYLYFSLFRLEFIFGDIFIINCFYIYL